MDTMELTVKTLHGESQVVITTPSTTIGELKRKIASAFNTRTSGLKLSVTDGPTIQLDHDQKTVSDYGLTTGSTVILLFPKTFQVFVRNFKGLTKTYEVTDDETVDQLMEKIRNKDGVAVDQQRLIFNSQQLQSGRKLQDYNITPVSTIHMTGRMRGG